MASSYSMSVLIYLQGHSHELLSGMVAVAGDAAEGSGIEACNTDHSMRSAEKNNFHLHV